MDDQAIVGSVVGPDRARTTSWDRAEGGDSSPLRITGQSIGIFQNPRVIVLWEASRCIGIASEDHLNISLESRSTTRLHETESR
jgi:hypothetical protein